VHEKFIARQPIFDLRLRVFAYELLFPWRPAKCLSALRQRLRQCHRRFHHLVRSPALTGHAAPSSMSTSWPCALALPSAAPIALLWRYWKPFNPRTRFLPSAASCAMPATSLPSTISWTPRTPAPSSELARFLKVDFQCLIPMRGNPSPPNTAARISPSSRESRTQRDLDEARSLGSPISRAYFSASLP